MMFERKRVCQRIRISLTINLKKLIPKFQKGNGCYFWSQHLATLRFRTVWFIHLQQPTFITPLFPHLFYSISSNNCVINFNDCFWVTDLDMYSEEAHADFYFFNCDFILLFSHTVWFFSTLLNFFFFITSKCRFSLREYFQFSFNSLWTSFVNNLPFKG